MISPTDDRCGPKCICIVTFCSSQTVTGACVWLKTAYLNTCWLVNFYLSSSRSSPPPKKETAVGAVKCASACHGARADDNTPRPAKERRRVRGRAGPCGLPSPLSARFD